MPRAMTPSQARTFSASSIVRSMRDGRRDGAERARRHDRELDRRHPRLGLGRGDARAKLRQLGAERLQARAEHGFGLRVERLRLQPCADARDLRSARSPRGCSSSSSVAWRSSIVTCCETIRPRPERPDDRVLHLPTGTRTVIDCASLLAGRDRRRDDVAAERAGEVEGVLRGAGDGVGVGDLDGERRADALGAVGRGARRSTAPGSTSVLGAVLRWSAPQRCRHARSSSLLRQRLGRGDVRAREPEHAGARERERRGGRYGDEHAAADREAPARPRAGCASAGRSRSRARALAAASGADGREARSSWIRSGDDVMVSHPLFELRKRATQPRRDGGRRNPEQACGLLAVQVEDDPQRDDLALAGAQRAQALLELGGEPLAERAGVVTPLGGLGALLALATARVGAEPVERGRARDREQPGAGRARGADRTGATS